MLLCVKTSERPKVTRNDFSDILVIEEGSRDTGEKTRDRSVQRIFVAEARRVCEEAGGWI